MARDANTAAQLRANQTKRNGIPDFSCDKHPSLIMHACGWDKERYTRQIFALDHHYKLFSDGRLFDIRGEGFREELVPDPDLSDAARVSKARLEAVIGEKMSGPVSDAANTTAFKLPRFHLQVPRVMLHALLCPTGNFRFSPRQANRHHKIWRR